MESCSSLLICRWRGEGRAAVGAAGRVSAAAAREAKNLSKSLLVTLSCPAFASLAACIF